jgi:50S ribosomal protein L16 3-hydroxylase
MFYQINWQQCANDMSPEKFLAQYWQKKPLLIKGAFSAFEDPIEADELAGLSMEVQIESRIVSQDNNAAWHVDHGPFEDFEKYGEAYWTLLVQATNNWSAQTHELLQPFKFIPNWRVDDVMVSFSTPNGGVGSHLDQYDVFIIQGQGKRRWQVGLPDNSLTTELPHEDLKQVSMFTPLIDEITEPGDLLYIPPNHPHNGVALENSLNYSIGFKAPSNLELWSSFADSLIDRQLGDERFADPDRTVANTPEVIAKSDFDNIKQFMLTTLNNETVFNDFICQHVTDSHHQLDILIPEELYTTKSLITFIEDAEFIEPVLGIKALFNQADNTLYIDGDKFELNQHSDKLGKLLAQNQTLATTEVKPLINDKASQQLLISILNMGFWYFG